MEENIEKIELDDIELFAVRKKDGLMQIKINQEVNEYQLLGILRTYTRALEQHLAQNWVGSGDDLGEENISGRLE